MKIALTGSSSYLATVLLPVLQNDPEIQKIIGIDLKAPSTDFSKLEWRKRDVRDAGIWKDFQGCDALIHLAFIVMPLRKTSEALDINIEGSKNVFSASAKARVKKIIYTSSCAAYGAWKDNPEIITEDQALRGMPEFYYSWSKAKVEEFLNEFEKKHPEIIITRLRPCIFLGPNINNLMRTTVRQALFFRYLDREVKAQYLWDEDMAHAIYLALKKDYPGAFNLAGDGTLSFPEMAKMMNVFAIPLFFKLAYYGIWLLWNLRLLNMLSPGWVKATEYPIIISSEKAKRVMGWKPKYDTKTAFAKFVEAINQEAERKRRKRKQG